MQGSYLVPNDVAKKLNWYLGNSALPTYLPVRVTYRPLLDLSALLGAAGAGVGTVALVDPFDAGLPLLPLRQDYAVPLSNYQNRFTGPLQSVPTVTERTVQSGLPGLAYERTMTPDPPFDQAYPPDVHIISSSAVGGSDNVSIGQPYELHGCDIPTFDISATAGVLDGWTAYLRDATTKQTLSPVRTLSGTTSCGVTLPTSHLPVVVPTATPNDALANTQLVIAAPGSEPAMPIELFAFPNIATHLIYGLLPPLAKVSGTVEWPGPPPVADIFFEATAVYSATVDEPDPCPSICPGAMAPEVPDGGDAGGLTYYANTSNYEFVAQASLTFSDASAAYSVEVPQGIYRIVVRPRDGLGSDGGAASITFHDGFDTSGGLDLASTSYDAAVPLTTPPPIVLASTVAVQGKATIGDGRNLAGAVVEALPLGCRPPIAWDGGLFGPDTVRCQPRYAMAP